MVNLAFWAGKQPKWEKIKKNFVFFILVQFKNKLTLDMKDFSIVTSISYLYSRKESFIMNKLNYYAWYETKPRGSTSTLHGFTFLFFL